MPSPISQTDICNLALMKLGMNPIQSITDLNSASAIALNTAWQLSVRQVMREHAWNCLKTRATLTEVAIPSSGTSTTPTVTSWQPNTFFASTTILTYGQGYYQYYIDSTSGSDLLTDLNTGRAYQTDISDTYAFDEEDDNGLVPLYEWSHSYQLPSDFILLVELNGTSALSKLQLGSEYEINGSLIYTDDDYADIKYVQYTDDVTRFDALFIDSLATLLASNVATSLKKDNGQTALALRNMFDNVVLPRAKVKDYGEMKARRYNPIGDSNFLAARYRSTNG
jgi:hypothetical protein